MAENSKKTAKKKNVWVEILIVLISILLAFGFSFTGAGQVLQKKISDSFMSLRPKPDGWDKILFVDIDDASIDNYGRFPWPRQKIGWGVDVLNVFGAESIVFDIEFTEPSDLILNDQDLYEITNFYMDASLNDLWDYLVISPDTEFTYSMAAGNVFLACRGTDLSEKETTSLGSDEFKMIDFFGPRMFMTLTEENAYLTNKLPTDQYLEYAASPLFQAASGMGFTTANYDENDGVLRRIFPFRGISDGYIMPHLAVSAMLDYYGIDINDVEIKPGKSVTLPMTNGDHIVIPLTKKSEMIISWAGKWEDTDVFDHLSFADLLDYYMLDIAFNDPSQLEGLTVDQLVMYQEMYMDYYQILSEKIAGKIVIIGGTATALGDIGPIPIQPLVPMVYTYANVMNTIYQQDFLRESPILLDLFIVMILGGILVLLGVQMNSAAKETLFSLVVILGLLVIDYLFISFFNIVLDYGMTTVGIVLASVSLIAFKFIVYDKEKNFIKGAFQSYLSPEVVDQVLDDPDLLKLGGKRMEITAYFSDVQGFTSISESMSPEQIVHLLNEYLTAMTEIILKHGGTVDKYEGDAIVAFFGAPIPHEDHARRACLAAAEMQEKLNVLRKKWVEEGYPEIWARMGMNSGPAIIGNMGSNQRMDYTMMGDTVNLAARLEGANKPYGTYTMISGATHEKLGGGFLTRKLDLLRVVGKSEPIEVFELIGLTSMVSDEKKRQVTRYNEGLYAYENRQWEKAMEIFRSNPGDAPSETYAKRCEQFIQSPPSSNWDGVFVLKNK